MQLGLLTKSINTPFRILTSFGEEHIVYINTSNKTLRLLVLFNPNNPDDNKPFKFTVSDWQKVFEDYFKCLSENRLSPLFVIAIIKFNSQFKIAEFSEALDIVCGLLSPNLKDKLLNDIWQTVKYSSNQRKADIISILSAHNTKYVVPQEKSIMEDATTYCNELSKRCFSPRLKGIPILENVDIFSKISTFDKIINTARFIEHTDNKLIQVLQWKNDLTSDFDFDTLKSFFYCFGLTSRWQIVRKLIYEKETSNRQITIEDLKALLESNPTIKAISDKYWGVATINFGLELLIYGLDTYNNSGKLLSQGKIVDILNQVKDRRFKIVLGLSSLFNFCNGGLLKNNKYNSTSNNSKYLFDKAEFLRNDRSGNFPYMYECLKDLCNGRLSSNKDEVLNKNFLWCNGHACFRSTIGKQTDFEKYRLIDCYYAFGHKTYEETDCGLIPNHELSRFIDTLGKLYRISSHLYCESCKQLLFPEKRSDREHISAYNTFSCQNPACEQKGTTIYINHCHTSNCKGVIDSRKLKKCPNGMYICPDCFGCCSEKFFQKQGNLQAVGHNDKGTFYCYKCGNGLIDNKCPTCHNEHKNIMRYKYQ